MSKRTTERPERACNDARATKPATRAILSMRIVTSLDTDPDLSFLGEYSQTPEEFHIDREERGDAGRGEYRYFNAGCGDPEYIEADYSRMEAYNRDDWRMIGIRAEARIIVAGVVQTIRSGGLYGVESDSDREYIDGITAEQVKELESVLGELGFSAKAIAKAFESITFDAD